MPGVVPAVVPRVLPEDGARSWAMPCGGVYRRKRKAGWRGWLRGTLAGAAWAGGFAVSLLVAVAAFNWHGGSANAVKVWPAQAVSPGVSGRLRTRWQDGVLTGDLHLLPATAAAKAGFVQEEKRFRRGNTHFQIALYDANGYRICTIGEEATGMEEVSDGREGLRFQASSYACGRTAYGSAAGWRMVWWVLPTGKAEAVHGPARGSGRAAEESSIRDIFIGFNAESGHLETLSGRWFKVPSRDWGTARNWMDGDLLAITCGGQGGCVIRDRGSNVQAEPMPGS